MSRFICPIIGGFFVFISVLAASANTLAIFRTSYGEMAFELFDEDKPVTVRTFILVTELGFYRNTFINRLATNFVAQGGNLFVQDPASTSLVSGVGAYNLGLIPNEFSTGRVLSNTYGTIAMAKPSTNANSSANTWFINLADNSANLDNQNGGFTVFGRLVHGEEVLQTMNSKSLHNGIVNLSSTLGTVFEALPVTYTGPATPRYNELVYAGIELLRLSVTPHPDGSRTLSWNSPTGLVCRIEADDGAGWNLFHLTNGNGAAQSVVDTNTVLPGRSYRVRIGP